MDEIIHETEEPSVSSLPVPEQEINVLSNKAKKRLLKAEMKTEYRKLAKQKKKEENKKRKLDAVGDTESAEANGAKDPSVVYPPHDAAAKAERKKREADEFAAKCAQSFSIILDCDWEDKHTEGTMKSLTQQIMFCYGINRRHDCPAPMYMTGVGPQVTKNLSKSNFSAWQGVTITAADYLTHPHFSVEAPPVSADTEHSADRVRQLVYLTSDAEETLETLDPNCAYIIGGIVDRNKHKFATYKKAKEQNIRTAKLPIKENFALEATHILTVNHVYHILLNYSKYQDWVQAIKEVMPTRKGSVEKSSANDVNDTNDTEDAGGIDESAVGAVSEGDKPAV